MTTPRESSRQDAEGESGASRIVATYERGKGIFAWVQTLRPVRAFSRFTDVGGSVLTGGMSYQALFAVFAGLWVGFGIFGLTLRKHQEVFNTLVEQINQLVPGLLTTAGHAGAVDPEVLLSARVLDWTSLIAGISLLWVAVNWFTGTRRSIRLIFGLEVKQYSNAVLLKLRDFALALTFFILILISAVLTVVGSSLLKSVLGWAGVGDENWLFSTLGEIVRFAAMLFFDVFVLFAMHRYLAELRIPWKKLLRGCLIGGVVLLGLKVGGTALLGGASSNPLLATFAVLIGLLIWFNLICRTLLLTSAWIACGLDAELGLPETGDSDDPLEGAPPQRMSDVLLR